MPASSRRLLPYGEHGLLLECADRAETDGLLRAIRDLALPEVVEVVPGARTLYLACSRPLSPQRSAQLRDLEPAPPPVADGELLRIPVRYDGEDLAEVADLLGLTPAEVVAAHTGQTWTVAFCGFAPGFGYLVGEHERLAVPRRERPRTAVPAGAVGLAGTWSGVYPRRGPGGWQLIGRTDATMWDLDRTPPALLQPGARVRFVDETDGTGAP